MDLTKLYGILTLVIKVAEAVKSLFGCKKGDDNAPQATEQK